MKKNRYDVPAPAVMPDAFAMRRKSMKIFYDRIPSPLGDVALIWKWKENLPSVLRVILPERGGRIDTAVRRRFGSGVQKQSHPEMEALCGQIRARLEGKPVEIPLSLLDLASCYPLQRRVLLADRDIPRGRVSSYGALALRLGLPRAARAVGSALARNPFPIIIPCHRVVRSDGSLGGFGGGIGMKRTLLDMEGVRFDAKGKVEKIFFW